MDPGELRSNSWFTPDDDGASTSQLHPRHGVRSRSGEGQPAVVVTTAGSGPEERRAAIVLADASVNAPEILI